MSTIKCAQEHCRNSISLPDALDSAATKAAMIKAGWTKKQVGWVGCGSPTRCSMVEPPPEPLPTEE